MKMSVMVTILTLSVVGTSMWEQQAASHATGLRHVMTKF
jgi:hypothetical protein